MFIEPRLYRGMRDILPSEMLHREALLATVREIFCRWGFAPIATPAIEFKDILLGKYGEDAERLFYKIEHKEKLALRYDLTVPLARVIAMSGNNLPTPFKRYQIQEVWRAERAQPRKGRFREFLQCDVDTIGTDSLVADAEIIALSVKVLDSLGFPNAITKINHRAILRGLMEVSGIPPESEMEVCRIIDKLDKIGPDGVRNDLLESGFNPDKTAGLLEIILENDAEPLSRVKSRCKANPRIDKGIADLQEVIRQTNLFGAPKGKIKVDLSLSRGLDYYTGTIFESVVPEQPHIGSLTGGGRYDDLIGLFSKRNIPAVGITIGLDRILAALIDTGKISERSTQTSVLVSVFDKDFLATSIKLASKLRENNIDSEVYLESRKLKAQFSYANKLGIPFVVIIGKNELQKGLYALKNMKTGEQQEASFEDLLIALRQVS